MPKAPTKMDQSNYKPGMKQFSKHASHYYKQKCLCFALICFTCSQARCEVCPFIARWKKLGEKCIYPKHLKKDVEYIAIRKSTQAHGKMISDNPCSEFKSNEATVGNCAGMIGMKYKTNTALDKGEQLALRKKLLRA